MLLKAQRIQLDPNGGTARFALPRQSEPFFGLVLWLVSEGRVLEDLEYSVMLGGRVATMGAFDRQVAFHKLYSELDELPPLKGLLVNNQSELNAYDIEVRLTNNNGSYEVVSVIALIRPSQSSL